MALFHDWLFEVLEAAELIMTMSDLCEEESYLDEEIDLNLGAVMDNPVSSQKRDVSHSTDLCLPSCDDDENEEGYDIEKFSMKPPDNRVIIIVNIDDSSELFTSNPILVNDYQSQKKIDSPDPERPLTFALLAYISNAKTMFAETIISLDLFGNNLQSPSRENAERTKLLVARGKSTYEKHQKLSEIDEILRKLRSFLIKKNSDNENEEYPDSNHECKNFANENVAYNLDCKCQPRSISEETLQRHLEKEKSKEKPERKLSPKDDIYRKLELENAVLKRQFQMQMETLHDRQKKLKEELEALKIEYRETLAQLGQITVEQTAKENDLRELANRANQRTRLSPTREDDRLGYPSRSSNGSLIDTPNDWPLNGSSSNDSSKSDKSKTNENAQPPPVNVSVIHAAALSQQAVQGSKTFVQSSILQNGRGKEMAANDKNESEFRRRNQESNDESISTDETTSNSLEKETRSDGEGINQPSGGEGINKSSGGEGISQSSGGEGINQSSCGKDIIQVNKVESISQSSGGESINQSNGGEGINQSREVFMGSASREESKDQNSTRLSYENLSFPVEQDDSNGKENISLRNVPPTSVATTLYNNYKLLLLTLAQRLLFNDVFMLTNWAIQNFSIDNSQNATDVLFKLDEKEVINASDLSQLRDFFESIVRIDLVHIIDAFLLGDYSFLRQTPTPRKRETEANRAAVSQRRATSWYPDLLNAANPRRSSQDPSNPLTTQTFDGAGSHSPQTATVQANADRNLAPSRKPENNNEPQSPAPQLTHKAPFPNFSANPNLTNSTLLARSPNDAQPAGRYGEPKLYPGSTGFTTSPISTAVTADGPATSERKTRSSNPSTRGNPAVKNQGSNGLKHSKSGRPESERANVYNAQSPGGSRNQTTDGDQDGNWLCSHYKRRCYVKFECCDKFWPCHRCHNNQSSCGRKKLKSRDTKMLKCVNCNKVQQFGECCIDCNSRFAKYFCRWCKHLTGTDDHPYHCEKCGICRIHGDRSFHCDICGVCLDVQLRGNHKCREGSAHDECCICLEDAFTGCQILPCSHKVHKDCATQMIRSGITRCPICRESFAHKLERRPPPNQRKRSGK